MSNTSGKIYNRDVRLSKGSHLYQNDNKITNYFVAAANYTTAGGAAAEAVSISGIKTTDIPLVTLQDNGTNNVTLTTAKITADGTLTVTFSGDPSDDTIISYAILRASA